MVDNITTNLNINTLFYEPLVTFIALFVGIAL